MSDAKIRVLLAKPGQQRHHDPGAIFRRGRDPQFAGEPRMVRADIILQPFGLLQKRDAALIKKLASLS